MDAYWGTVLDIAKTVDAGPVGASQVFVAVALIGQDGLTAGAPMAPTFGAGVCIVGGQYCLNALAAIYYPTSVRSTGVG